MTNHPNPTNPLPSGVVPEFTLGDRLRKARQVANLDIQDLARRIEINRQSLTRYETGEAAPKRHVVLAWSVETGVDASWILGESN